MMRYFLACAAVLIASSFAGAQSKRPNVLIFFSDDQRADTIAALGNSHIQTPNLDGLVKRGLVFSRAYCMGSMQGAVCVPSRAMLLTGRSLFHIQEQLKGQTTWMEMFARAGYATFISGKWHNGPESLARVFPNAKSVFLGGMTVPFQAPIVDVDQKQLVNKRKSNQHPVQEFTDQTVAFLKKQSKDQPFLAYVPFNAPHDPRTAPKEYHAKYDPAKIPVPANFLPEHPFDNGEMKIRDEKLAPWPRTKEVVQQHVADYYALVTFMDAQIGRILQTLQESGLAENTIIVFASDSGLAIGSHGLFGKQNLYEHSMRVPLIIAGPGIPQGQSDSRLCYLFDVLPTLGARAGIEAPKGSEGLNLLADGPKRDQLFFAYTKVQRAVRDDRWKLIAYPNVQRVQLFDLQNDPAETNDLSAKEPAQVKRLAGMLNELQKKYDDTLAPVQISLNRPDEKLPLTFDVQETVKDFTVLGANPDGVPPRKMLNEYLKGETKKLFDARREVLSKVQTPDQVLKRQVELKAKFIDAIGGLPEKTPLNVKVVGVDKRDGYRVERLIYESRPNHHVTANLYIPDGKGPFPAILMPIGHSSAGKADGSTQRAAILFAKHGMATLSYDPISQGERKQLIVPDGKTGISMTSEHTLIGVGALLVGRNTAGYRIWDGMRSLDVLQSRPEIDGSKLGATGCSGGGTLTSYLMALDDRIICAAPSCYITSLERLFATLGPQDAEQNIPGQVAFGMEHADFLNMRAPLPTLIAAASRDFFDIQGTWNSFREATLTYGILNHSERVNLVEFNTTHGYPKQQREAIARWMKRWLVGKDEMIVEENVPTTSYKDLTCTRSGQVLEDLQGKSVFQLTLEEANRLAKERADRKLSDDDVRKQMAKLLALPAKIEPAKATDAGEVQRDGFTIRKRIFRTEAGIQVPAVDVTPAKGGQKIVILIDGHGMANSAAEVERRVKAGERVIALDPRGIGETSPGVLKDHPMFGVDWNAAFISQHIARPLLGQKTFDVLSVVQSLKGEKLPLEIVGVGPAAPIALHAGFLDPALTRVTLDKGLRSWHDVARTPVSLNQLTNVVPGVLRVYDLPELAARLGDRVTIHQPVDARGEMVK